MASAEWCRLPAVVPHRTVGWTLLYVFHCTSISLRRGGTTRGRLVKEKQELVSITPGVQSQGMCSSGSGSGGMRCDVCLDWTCRPYRYRQMVQPYDTGH